MDRFLHASTPARRGNRSTLLGTRQSSCALLLEARQGSDAYPTRSHAYAVASISPLSVGAGSRLFAPGSWLLDLTSPNAKRHTARSWSALLAAGRNYNQCESIDHSSLVSSSTGAASRQALGAVVVGRFFASGLSDGLTGSKNRQIWLSGAVNGMSSAPLPLNFTTIHNFLLYITKWVEIEKMDTSIFSVFNRTCSGPRIGRKVNRGFLATALRKSGIDFVNKLWHVPACSRCIPAARRSRRPASKPGVFKYMVSGLEVLYG